MSDWSRTDKALTRTFAFPSFSESIAFVNRLALYAESVDHHPDVLISYKKVTVTWTTHDAGGVTEKDEAGAKAADQQAQPVPVPR